MTARKPAKPTAPAPAPAGDLSEAEAREVNERKAGSSRVVHEVIRQQGDEEAARPLLALTLAGLAGGVSISASVLAEAALKVRLPDAPWAELVAGLGYTLGFIIAIMGRLQLFTENTVTAVLPVATQPTWKNFAALGRVWGVVLLTNLIGTMLVALMIDGGAITTPEMHTAILGMAGKMAAHSPGQTLLLGIPAGFLVASVAWILPNARGSEFWVIFVVTYVIAIGGFTHIIAGSTEMWTLWLSGGTGFGTAVAGVLIPALVGNIIGGTGLFALMAHGQAKGEI